MIIYLAGYKTIEKYYKGDISDIYLLSSFWEHKNGRFGDYVYQEKHMLDSGAFSVINDRKGRYKNYDWDAYVKKYIAFIKQTKQKLFFELDIDCAVGLEKVEYYRKQIEDAVGIPPIPVWHSNRKWEYFVMCCEKYPYVAVPTTRAGHEGRTIRNDMSVLKKFIHTAHSKGKRIHGLGFTSTTNLKEFRFDSVDSTTWNVGAKYSNICIVTPNGEATQEHRRHFRVKDRKVLNLYNFEQWVRFQKYAEEYL